jgi:hypothetical protein
MKKEYDIQMADLITGFNEDEPSVEVTNISFSIPSVFELIPASSQNAMIHITYIAKGVKKWIQLTPIEAEKIGFINLDALRKFTDVDVL